MRLAGRAAITTSPPVLCGSSHPPFQSRHDACWLAASNALAPAPALCLACQGDDPELARALAASLADHPDGTSRAQAAGGAWGAPRALPAQHDDDEDADLAAAIAASLAGSSGEAPMARHAQAGSGAAEADARQGGDDEDPELAAAIAASLQQEAQPAAEPAGAEQPAEMAAATAAGVEQQTTAAAPVQRLPELAAEPEAGEEGAIEVAVRLPGGGRASRRFLAAQDTVGHLAAFAAAQGADVAGRRCQLAAGFPRRLLTDWNASLAAAGVGHKELVTVEMS